jgi:hypothetical protein
MGLATSSWAQEPLGFAGSDTCMMVMKPNGHHYYDPILAQPNLHHNSRAEVIN